MTRARRLATRRRQRGAAFYAFVVAAVAMMATLAIALGTFERAAARSSEDMKVLQEAKRLLLAHLASPDLDVPVTGRRMGEFGLFPDLAAAAIPVTDPAEPNYDGNAERSGCAFRGWLPGQPLQPVSATTAAARCIGRFPWRELGLSLDDPDTDPRDLSGQVPWMVFSPNLAAGAGCVPNLTPMMLALPYAGYPCAGAGLPHRWLRVVDDLGNTLSDRVAIALILPGRTLAGQVRGANAGPAAWLDALTVNAGCPMPCVPGTYDNAGYNHPDGQPTTLVSAALDPRTAATRAWLATPVEFNDRMVWVTIDEVIAALETRARNEALRQLAAYKATYGAYPSALPLDTAVGCVAGATQTFGRLPTDANVVNAGTCIVPPMPGWFNAAGWSSYFLYAVSPRCAPGNTACNAPGLQVGANNGINALLLSGGAPWIGPAFAASLGAAQQPWRVVPPPTAADFLDSVENAGGTPNVFEYTAGLPAPNNDRVDVLP